MRGSSDPFVKSRFKPAKVFKNAVDVPTPDPNNRKSTSSIQITGLSFDDRGETLVTAGGDETFRLYNIKSGKYGDSSTFSYMT